MPSEWTVSVDEADTDARCAIDVEQQHAQLRGSRGADSEAERPHRRRHGATCVRRSLVEVLLPDSDRLWEPALRGIEDPQRGRCVVESVAFRGQSPVERSRDVRQLRTQVTVKSWAR